MGMLKMSTEEELELCKKIADHKETDIMAAFFVGITMGFFIGLIVANIW